MYFGRSRFFRKSLSPKTDVTAFAIFFWQPAATALQAANNIMH